MSHIKVQVVYEFVIHDILCYLFFRYDAPNKKSRVDYYGDMVKTYQLADDGYGTSLKIAPVTTEEVENARTCLQVNGTKDDSIEIQSVLPSLLNFECAGKIMRI